MIEIIKKATPIPRTTIINGSIAVVKPLTVSSTSLSKYSDALLRFRQFYLFVRRFLPVELKGREKADNKHCVTDSDAFFNLFGNCRNCIFVINVSGCIRCFHKALTTRVPVPTKRPESSGKLRQNSLAD